MKWFFREAFDSVHKWFIPTVQSRKWQDSPSDSVWDDDNLGFFCISAKEEEENLMEDDPAQRVDIKAGHFLPPSGL